MRPIVLIELNEVPNLVLDTYAGRSPFMAEWLASSDRYTTVAADRIQLDPWIAWPSFHRGVNDETHGLLHLGQSTDTADRFPPVWKMLQHGGIPVGVYGSLFSSAEIDLSPYSFFVPDVFSPHSRVNPPELTAFQDFNLRMTRASGRNADSGVSGGAGRALTGLVRDRRVRPSTLSRAARQLVAERIDRKRLSRRRNIQTELHADIFASLVAQRRPSFSTFYTNNVAAAMHRFWAASLPGQSVSRDQLDPEWLAGYADDVEESLYSVERLLRLLDSGRCGDVTVVVASAIGQEEIPAENHRAFLAVVDPRRFAAQVLSASSGYELLPTMVPDLTFRFDGTGAADLACERLGTMQLDGVLPVRTQKRMRSTVVEEPGTPLAHIRHNYGEGHFKHAFTFGRSDDHTVHVSLQVDDYAGEPKAIVGDQILAFDEVGLGLVRHEEGVNCTAQHCAEGSLVVHGTGHRTDAGGPRRVSSLDFAPSVLTYFGVELPNHLQGRPTVRLGEPTR